MRKWKIGYPLKKLKSEDGLTLVELLAGISLLSIIIILVGSAHLFGQKQYKAQTQAANQANDIAISLSVLTRDLRGAEEVSFEEGVLTVDNITRYTLDSEDKLIKNDHEVLAEHVASFSVAPDQEANSIQITLQTSPYMTNKAEGYQTTIYFRRGGLWEENNWKATTAAP